MKPSHSQPRVSSKDRLRIYRRVLADPTVWNSERAASHARSRLDVLQRAREASGCEHKQQLRLTLDEREEISRLVAMGRSVRSIARQLGRSPSTVSRELARNGGRRNYRAFNAEVAACERALRPREFKLNVNAALQAQVAKMIGDLLSPQQVSARLQAEFPDDPSMRVSHETIYQSLFVQSRGTFRKELTAALRSGRTARRPQGAQLPSGSKIKGMVMISERPGEVADRAVPGHWEGDLIVGKANRSAIVTLVERHTRFVMLGRIGKDRTSESVLGVIEELIQRLPGELFKTLTWDQGSEMAGHQKFTVDTGVQVYFCDPHSPWQRGSNENTNGLLRQYFPKKTELQHHDQAELDRVAAQLNTRPRQTLEWKNPAEKLAELLR